MDLYPSPNKPDKHIMTVNDAEEYIDVTFGISVAGFNSIGFPSTRIGWKTLFEIQGLKRRPQEFPYEMECSTKELLDLVEGTLEGHENMLASKTLDYLSGLATSSVTAS